jgi:hypothetical protein
MGSLIDRQATKRWLPSLFPARCSDYLSHLVKANTMKLPLGCSSVMRIRYLLDRGE